MLDKLKQIAEEPVALIGHGGFCEELTLLAREEQVYSMIEFEWDDHKNELNRKKHGIWFEEAEQVFSDTNSLLFHDSKHSDHEDRFILLGMSASARILVVVHCERDKGKVIRIISARKATKKEIKQYEKGI